LEPADLDAGDPDAAGQRRLRGGGRTGSREREQRHGRTEEAPSQSGSSVASASRAFPGSSLTMPAIPSRAREAIRSGSLTVQAITEAPRAAAARTTAAETS